MLSPQIRRDRKERIPSPQRLLDGAKDQTAALLAGARCTCDRIRPDQHREAWRKHRDAVSQNREVGDQHRDAGGWRREAPLPRSQTFFSMPCHIDPVSETSIDRGITRRGHAHLDSSRLREALGKEDLMRLAVSRAPAPPTSADKPTRGGPSPTPCFPRQRPMAALPP